MSISSRKREVLRMKAIPDSWRLQSPCAGQEQTFGAYLRLFGGARTRFSRVRAAQRMVALRTPNALLLARTAIAERFAPGPRTT